MGRDDRGSTLPLVLGFFVVAATTVAASIAAGDAFVQQRHLQAVCDGAALAAAATAVEVGRGAAPEQPSLTFAAVSPAITEYLSRDPVRRDVQVTANLRDSGRTLVLTCSATDQVIFGRLFGYAAGVRHVVHSAAQAPVR